MPTNWVLTAASNQATQSHQQFDACHHAAAGSVPEDTASQVAHVVRHACIMEGVQRRRHRIVAAVHDDKVGCWRSEEAGVVGGPPAQAVLHDAAQVPACARCVLRCVASVAAGARIEKSLLLWARLFCKQPPVRMIPNPRLVFQLFQQQRCDGITVIQSIVRVKM